MTFTRQLSAIRLMLILLTGAATTAVLLALLRHQWAILAALAPLMAVFAWLVHFEWRLFSRQRDLAGQAEQLRQVARGIPTGMDRIYTSVLTTTAIHCRPGSTGGSDQFSEFDMSDMDAMDRKEPGTTVDLPAVTYQVRRSVPLVWRRVWADRGIRTVQPGGYATLPQPTTNYRDVLRLFLLNHRTGLLVPDRSELANLLHTIENADHTGDTPRKTK